MSFSVQKLVLALGFMALGATAATWMPAAEAGTTGGWSCYVMDRMPDVVSASEWRHARSYAEGLNAAAPHAASGTVVPTFAGTSAMMCVKGE